MPPGHESADPAGSLLGLDQGGFAFHSDRTMGSINILALATLFFVGGHFLLSSRLFRRPLVARLGARGFQAFYSLAILVAFVWMVQAYGRAAPIVVWSPPSGFAWIPLIAMLPACVLVVAGLSTPNPTMVGGERLVSGATGPPVQGILTVTRHPFLCGTTLWAAAHLSVRGDLAGIVLFGGLLILSVGGMRHIDQRREADVGAAWGPVKLTTSVLPLAAALTGRTKIDWRGIGVARLLGGLALYGALLVAHDLVLGVSVLPV